MTKYRFSFHKSQVNRAQLEAAWRPTSDLKYILGVLRCVQIWGASTPRGQNLWGRNLLFRKKSSWVDQHERL